MQSINPIKLRKEFEKERFLICIPGENFFLKTPGNKLISSSSEKLIDNIIIELQRYDFI